MGYAIPKPPMMPLPKPLQMVLSQRVKIVFCNTAALKAVANLRKGEVVSCDNLIVLPIEEA